ncbi:SDR family oxidoreductase [Nicoliella spurrieriana]|uniref:SDR family oxidoreductase n=1 Tax=Nicoliella spurrieriana TaxID=2925830 RepID=A0A976X666_9LACO|nr:SDR family oxidoreductase [Nicoliella spurrieriana]UQS87197.1 SDR family oxidoreductase [Nicoliella spurrieriana]
MKTVLVLGSQKPTARLAIHELSGRDDVHLIELDDEQVDVTYEKTYLPFISDVNIIISFLGPLDVDIAFEGLFDAIRASEVTLTNFVMISTAGIDNEVTGTLQFPAGVSDVNEYLKQQRYAIKVVDEAEIPYTVIRPVTVVDQVAGPVKVYDEGEKMPTGFVSRETVARVAVQSAVEHQYVNQSIGLFQNKKDV